VSVLLAAWDNQAFPHPLYSFPMRGLRPPPLPLGRTRVFEDGLILLDRLGQGQARFEVEMDNGIRSGRTQEFFTLFSHELCRRSRGLWLSHDRNAEYVAPGNGLFPRPGANPNLFYILEILCAKAFTSGYRIEIPIHPCFFDVVGGRFD
jgi:hypothetical protein